MSWEQVREVLGRIAEFATQESITLAGGEITVVSVLVFAVILAATYYVSRLVQRAAERALRTRGITDEGTVGITRRLLHYVVMAVGIAVGLENLQIELSALFAAGAVFAVGIGFAMQNIAQNFVSGVILLLERAIKPGDVLEVEGEVVRIQRMGIRSTVARTRDEEEIIIPNSTLVQGTVKNYTLADSLYRVRATVGVAYESDLREAAEVLAGAAGDLAWRLEEREPLVLLKEFGASSVNFEVSVWIDDPWGSPGARSRLAGAIWWALKDAGITIAFPQIDVHFDPPVMDAVETLPRAV